jgi:hypothetical protein
MRKKIIFTSLAITFALLAVGFGVQAQAAGDYNGQIVKMNGLTSVYYVASDGKRYVFPNEKIYLSWFPDFDDVLSLSESELVSLPLGGNVLYRPGILLVKITTDPKVYAVAEGGVLRWVKTEAIAQALYGNDWNKLIDDVPDSFFTNYQIGNDIDDESEYDPEGEADSIDTIDANHGLSTVNAMQARTRICRMIGSSRDCQAGSDSDADENKEASDDDNAPYITNMSVSNGGKKGYIDAGDKITITFNEALDPHSINSGLEAGNYYISLEYGITGAINVDTDGIVTIEDIALFELGKVEDEGQFAVKMELSSSARVLGLTIVAGAEVEIEDEDFDDAEQIGGTIKDKAGNRMEDDDDISTPSGTFGGENVNDGIEPFISAIKVYNGGEEGYIDEGDEITITFSEDIDPESIHNDLDEGGSVDNVGKNETGGVIVDDNGFLTITDIARFYVGEVDDDGEFIVALSLDADGEKLTITLADGDRIEVKDEDLDDAEQIGGVVEDDDGNEMEDDPQISDPTGSFIEDTAAGDIYISGVKAYDYGYPGYIDIDDRLVITFNEEIEGESINNNLNAGGTVTDIESDEVGGMYINSNGLLTVTDILSFDVGDVEEAREFDVKLSLSSSGKVLTITITDGEEVEINREDFDNTTQIGGTIENTNNNVMGTLYDIDDPEGTFGGDSGDTPPYISSIEVENGDDEDSIDVHDKIVITFNEAVNPESIDNNLKAGDNVKDVDDNDTGGVVVNHDGTLTVTNITRFYVGDVEDNGEFRVKVALNSSGNVLTITLTSGDDIAVDDQDLDEAEQIGGTVEDEDGYKMETDPRIDDPTGSF